MFGMSMTEIIIIVVVALLILGPKDLPNAAKSLGKAIREVRKAGDDLRETFEREVMLEPEKPTKPPEGAVASGSEKQDDSTASPNALPPVTQTNAPPVADASSSSNLKETA